MSAGFLHHLQHAIGAIGASSKPSSQVLAPTVCDAPRANEIKVLEATARSIVIDFDGHLTSVGRYWRTQHSALEPGVRLFDLIHVADRIAWMSALSEFKSGRDTDPVLLRLNKAAPNMPQSFVAVSLAYESTSQRHIRLDMWEEQQAQPGSVQTEKLEGEFLAMMSHEFRTPLNAILGFSGLLNHTVSEALTEAQKAEYIDLIRSAAEHMLAMVNGILDVSKIGAGKYDIHPEPFDFKTMVDEAVCLIATQANGKNIKVNSRPVLKDFGQVNADRRAIKQVLINLLSNAVKFTPDNGCITIDAWFERETLAFAVSDTGIGMSKTDQERIFSAFSQIDNGTTRQAEGTGLGLCLVKGLVGLHGGDITVSSSKNVGTRMLIHIPNAHISDGARPCTAETTLSPGGNNDALRQSA